MLSCTMLILFSNLLFVTAHQPTPSTPQTTTPPTTTPPPTIPPTSTTPTMPSPLQCEYNGRVYAPGEDIRTSDKCEMCWCELVDYNQAKLSCAHADYFTPMCYNPRDNGPEACYQYTCPERNCITPSGHVLVGNQQHYFNDDGLCRCPEQPRFLPGDQWKPENGAAMCHQQVTTAMPIG